MKNKLYKLPKTKISWADYVWNVITGCDKVSSGCKFCYAEVYAHRYWKGRPFNDVQFHPERLNFAPFKTNGNIIFVNSMSDLFHEKIREGQIVDVMNAIESNQGQWFVVLTKRPERAREFFDVHDAPVNLILGVSVEDALNAEKRLGILLKTEVAHRIVSIEPYLPWKENTKKVSQAKEVNIQHYTQSTFKNWKWKGMIEWVIVGAESGPGKRYCDQLFIKNIVISCLMSGTPVYVKQIHTKKDAKGKFKVLSNPHEFPERLQFQQFMHECSIERLKYPNDLKEVMEYMYPSPVIDNDDERWANSKHPHCKPTNNKKTRVLKHIEILSVNVNGGFAGKVRTEDYK